MPEVEWFADLLVGSLTGVGFFADYVQLHFNLHPLLNIYTPILLVLDGTARRSGEPEFPGALIGQIRKRVARVTIELEKSISIHFRDASVLSFSTRRDEATPEAFTLFTRGGAIYEE